MVARPYGLVGLAAHVHVLVFVFDNVSTQRLPYAVWLCAMSVSVRSYLGLSAVISVCAVCVRV